MYGSDWLVKTGRRVFKHPCFAEVERSSVQTEMVICCLNSTCNCAVKVNMQPRKSGRLHFICTTPHPKDVGKVVAEAVSDLEHVLSSLCSLLEQTIHSSSQFLQSLPPPPAGTQLRELKNLHIPALPCHSPTTAANVLQQPCYLLVQPSSYIWAVHPLSYVICHTWLQ